MSAPKPQRRSPYQGLIHYGEDDAPYFFGREKETRLITANLFASSLTLIYGASGVGKSSVLRAGVARQLRLRADLLVVVFSAWQGDAISGLKAKVAEAAAKVDAKYAPSPAALSLSEYLARCAAHLNRRLMIILDQFEEYFLYHPAAADQFTTEFSEAVTQADAPLNFLISIREDSLAKLDRFEDHIPTLFDNYLRIEHLSREAARAAIEKPIEKYNQLSGADPPIIIEPALVDTVLTQIQTGRVVLSEVGRGVIKADGAKAEPAEAQIETPYLQMVMTRLWDEETSDNSHVLRLKTLERLGWASRIVRTHLNGTMSALSLDDQEIAARVFHYLVTPTGSKIAHLPSDLAKYTLLPKPKIESVLEKLSGGDERILNPVVPPDGSLDSKRYEISHDVLAPAILDWRARFEDIQKWTQSEVQLAREQRRVILLRLLLIGISLALIILALWARSLYRTYRQALVQERISRTYDLVTNANYMLDSDPQLSVILAAKAAGIEPTADAVNILRRSLLKVGYAKTLISVLKGHTDYVHSANFSHDGKLLVTASRDGTARVWDLNTGETIKELRGSPKSLATAIFSPDRRLIVTASTDATARIWDANKGETLHLLKHQGPVNSAAFSPDGKYVVTASDDRTAKIWDADTGAEVRRLEGHTTYVAGASFSPDGKFIVTAGWDGKALVWDLGAGPAIKELLVNGHLAGAKFSPDGRLIVTASDDGKAKIWDAVAGHLVATLSHPAFVSSAAFSPDGKFILTASSDGLARVWNLDTRQAVIVLKHRDHRVYGASFSPDGKFIATASWDYTAQIWRIRDRPQSYLYLGGDTDDVKKLAPSPDGRFIVSASHDRRTQVWDISTGESVAVMPRDGEPGHTGWVNSAVFSPDGKLIATSSSDWTARIWEVSTRNSLRELKGHSAEVNSAAFSPDGKYLVTASDDRTARMWDVSTGQTVKEFRAQANLLGAAFSPDGRLIAAAGGDKSVLVWEVYTGQLKLELKGHTDRVNTASFSPGGDYIVTASNDTTARVWEVKTGRQRALLGGFNSWANNATFSPDGRLVLTASNDGVRVWEWEKAGKGGQPVTLNPEPMRVDSAIFSPDGFFVIAATGGTEARLYSWEQFAPVQDLIAMSGRRIDRVLTPEENKRYLHQ